MTERLLDCDLCGADVVETSGPGRTYQYLPCVSLGIPDDMTIPTCVDCGETYLNDSEARALDDALAPALIVHIKRLVAAAADAAGVTCQEVERAAAIPTSYWSGIGAGRLKGCTATVRLLEAFARYPAEVKRHLEGKDWFYD